MSVSSSYTQSLFNGSANVGRIIILTPPTPVILVSGTASLVTNRIYLDEGVWSVNIRYSITTGVDTVISTVVATRLNEAGQISSSTLIQNGSTAGVFNTLTLVKDTIQTVVVPSTNENEYISTVTWSGSGTAPTCSASFFAVKLA
jgi:hypothetical protein